MIRKLFLEAQGETLARVTFELPDAMWVEQLTLVGDFNDWDTRSHPFGRDGVGRWTITVDLEPRRAYQFRYLADGKEWMNDREADAHVHNMYGSDNSVVVTDPEFKRYCEERNVNQ